MKLITRHEAARLSLEELHGLFREAFNAAAAAPRGSKQRRDALNSLDVVERELASRVLAFKLKRLATLPAAFFLCRIWVSGCG